MVVDVVLPIIQIEMDRNGYSERPGHIFLHQTSHHWWYGSRGPRGLFIPLEPEDFPLTNLSLQFREYLETHGYDTSAMGLPGSDESSIDENEKVKGEA